MSKKKKIVYSCQSCGAQRPRWEGKCTECGAWNSFVEEVFIEREVKASAAGWVTNTQIMSLDQDPKEVHFDRTSTGLIELDRTLGGGLVRGSFVLMGGPPGIGKSTLLLQMCAGLAKAEKKVLYVSGEESVAQTGARAQRLGVRSGLITIAAESDLDRAKALIEERTPDVVIIDSIQTLFLASLEAAPGSVSQVRECAGRLLQLAKGQNITVILVGHVTKDGQLAGPKVLEHMVDTVLSFEGDPQLHFRMLRTTKNRFGPANELGIFRMMGIGLEEVKNPSELFLEERSQSIVGSVIFAALEGSRPLLCEIQALAISSMQMNPRRTTLGIDVNRLHMISAVLDRFLDLELSRSDIFINVVGGLRLTEPACDLAVAAALLSNEFRTPVSGKTVFIGELGLTGEVRSVAHLELRLKEAAKLGFTNFVIPHRQKKQAQDILGSQIEIHSISSAQQLRGLMRNAKTQPEKKLNQPQRKQHHDDDEKRSHSSDFETDL